MLDIKVQEMKIEIFNEVKNLIEVNRTLMRPFASLRDYEGQN